MRIIYRRQIFSLNINTGVSRFFSIILCKNCIFYIIIKHLMQRSRKLVYSNYPLKEVKMRARINIFIFFSLFFVSCTVKPPEFVVKGVDLKSALLSLEEGDNKEGAFSHYVEHLRDHHAPGFSWSQYWSEIEKNQLYKNLTEENFNKLLSLSEISCRGEDRDAFADFLLQIAKTDSKKILFSHQLSRLNEVCSTFLSNSAFKPIVQFLVRKREEIEAEKIQQEKKKDFISASALISASDTGDVAHSHLETRYIYTEELQKLLVEEWTRTKKVRAWNDILSIVDRSFWSDVRWINYKQGNKEHLSKTLEMEFSAYQSIENLEQDIFLMFEEENKMEDTMTLAEYKRYFATGGSVNWSTLYEKLLLLYPEKPNNGNVKPLLSFYSFSCQDQDLHSYFKLVDQWNASNYKDLAVKFCVDVLRVQVFQGGEQVDEGKPKTVAEKEWEILREKEWIAQGITSISYQELEDFFKNHPDHRDLKAVGELLFVYSKEKYKRSTEEWKKLLDYFSEEDWLNIMGLLRARHDRSAINDILAMHNQAYAGQIPFLVKDVLSVVSEGEKSILEITDQYGYNRAYFENVQFLKSFWVEVEKSHTSSDTKYDIKIEDLHQAEQKAGKICNYSYIKSLFQFFSFFDKKDLLFNQFSFENCPGFVAEFRQREWNKIVNQIQETDWDLSSSKKLSHSLEVESVEEDNKTYQFVRWLVGVLSLYPDSLVTPAISQIHKKDWEDIILILILSLKGEPNFTNMCLFYEAVYRVDKVYPSVASYSVCRFFGYEDSHFLIQNYETNLIIDLFDMYNTQHQEISHFGGRTRHYSRYRTAKNTCGGLVSQEKINTLLFVTARSFLSDISLLDQQNTSYLSELWRIVDYLSHLFKEVNSFALSVYQSNKLWRYFKNVPSYDSEKGTMSTESLGFYFMVLVFREVQIVKTVENKSVKEVLPLEENEFYENEFYEDFIYLMKKALQEKDMNQELKELNLLEDKLFINRDNGS